MKDRRSPPLASIFFLTLAIFPSLVFAHYREPQQPPPKKIVNAPLLNWDDGYQKSDGIDKQLEDYKRCSDMKKKGALYTELTNVAQQAYWKKEYWIAYKLYNELAADDPSGDAQFKIGYMYASGEGVIKNTSKAIYWYEDALVKRKRFYKNIPPKDAYTSIILTNLGAVHYQINEYINAFHCYHNASVMGNAGAQTALAYMYAHGQGILEDDKQAYAWSSVALAQGLENKKFAEDIKNSAEFAMKIRDKTHSEFKIAKNLAQQYYDLYIPH